MVAARVAAPRSGYTSSGFGYSVHFDVLDGTSGQYREKCRAYLMESVAHRLHRGHVYRVKFNANMRNPMIVAILEELAM
jgi:hypothetical protein